MEKGSLVVSRARTIFILVTGEGKRSKWGGYPTFAGVVLKNLDQASSIRPATYSDTWNMSEFYPYEGEILVDGSMVEQAKPVDDSQG